MTTDLQLVALDPDAARIVPEPFTAAALFLNSNSDPIPEIEDFLRRYRAAGPYLGELWVTMVYDKRFNDYAIAQAAYSLSEDRVVREALFVHPLYAANDFGGYFDNLGSSLFGNLPVYIPVPRTERE